MANNIYWVQNGGHQEENDQRGLCFFPKYPMAPESCAEKYGLEGTHWHGPTAGHRGEGTFANSRILHFEDFDYCRPACLAARPFACEPENDKCDTLYQGIEGWRNQDGLWDYYCRDIHDKLAVGDCFATHIIPAIESFDTFFWGVGKAVPGVMVKFKTMCSGIDLTPEIDGGVAGTKYECMDVPKEARMGNLCDGFDTILMEILALPEPAEEGDDCEEGLGKLEGFSILGSASTRTVCTGK